MENGGIILARGDLPQLKAMQDERIEIIISVKDKEEEEEELEEEEEDDKKKKSMKKSIKKGGKTGEKKENIF